MTSISLLLLGISKIYALVFLGIRIEHRCKLSRYYISPPLTGGGIGALLWIAGTYTMDFDWVPQPAVGLWLVTLFLFFVGIKIGLLYTKRHVRSLIVFSAFAVGLLLIVEILARVLLNESDTAFTVFGSISFAWNDEWLSFVSRRFPEAEAVSYTSLLLVFAFTPIVISLLNKRFFKISGPSASLHFKEWSPRGAFIVFLASLSTLWMKHLWFGETMFVFAFVLSMTVGIGVGFLFRKKPEGLKPNFFPTVAEAGKLSLYGFIVFMFLKAAEVVYLHGSWKLFGLVFVKISVVSFILILVARRRMKNHKHMVWAGAAWAFTLSAPVTCMNAMRSVVDRHGEADDIVYIVPPVILWLINYPHYFLFTWIHG